MYVVISKLFEIGRLSLRPARENPCSFLDSHATQIQEMETQNAFFVFFKDSNLPRHPQFRKFRTKQKAKLFLHLTFQPRHFSLKPSCRKSRFQILKPRRMRNERCAHALRSCVSRTKHFASIYRNKEDASNRHTPPELKDPFLPRDTDSQLL